ncbi:MAG TPA: beta-propeller fold lactonase family protein, partial [Polyangiaceae bacterium]|nr:beta-propeller fold lactonase family protein [Polyangiaceae bacterium]
LDKVQQLTIGAGGMLGPNTPASVATVGGAGPRHIAVHPNGTLAFVANELDSTVTPYQLSADGKLTAGTPVSSVPAGAAGNNKGAHVEVSPNGRFVYASNRGHNSIAVFSADPTTGALTLIETEPTRGNTPRDFDVDPNGEVLIVANQDSATLSVYKIEEDGGLSPLGTPTPSAPMPSAVQIHYLP